MASPLQIVLRPIGVVHTVASDDEIREGPVEREATIEVYAEFAEALEGIEGFSHLFLLCYFHKLRPEQQGALKVRPRRLLKRGFTLEELPLVGVFALDSPTRPNPLGLTVVQFLRREERRLVVKGLDYFDGTPVLDIKPYQPDYHVETYTLPAWYSALLEKAGGHI